jgi:hypothetical protein
MSIEPLQKQCNQIFPLQEFVPVTLNLNNILANTHFSVIAVIRFNIDRVMRNYTDHIKLKLLYDVIT